MDKKSNSQKDLIKTNQSLVHVKHSISIRQYKYWFLLLNFYKNLMEEGIREDKDGFYYVSISEITNFLGYEPQKKELKTDFEALRKEPIILNYLEKDGKSVTHGMGFISEWKITSNRIAFKLPSFVQNAVKGDAETRKMFLLLNWEIFNSFEGKYEAIIYKLCKDYIGIGRTPYFTIEEYREYIGLEENEYTLTDNLTRRCINNPIKNINKNDLCDIFVSVIFSRKGMKIVGLYFEIEHKQQTNNNHFIEAKEPSPAFKKARFAITTEKQIKYLTIFTEPQIEAIIDRANTYIDELRKNRKKANIGAIYSLAFAEGWGLENFEDEQKRKAEAEEKRRKEIAKQNAEIQKQREEEEKKEARRQEQQKYISIFENLPKEQQEKILDHIQEQENTGFFLNNFLKKREEGTAHKDYFIIAEIIEYMKNQNIN